MGIHTPELRVTQTLDDFRNDQASAAAYFDGDPYFARVGAIGIVQAVRPKELAKEACAAKTVEFLIKTVEDDESRGVDENTKQRNSEFQVKLWEERAELAKVSQRLLDDAPAFMPMDEEYVEII